MLLVNIITCADTLGLKFCWHGKLGFMSWQTRDETVWFSFQRIWSKIIFLCFQFWLMQAWCVFNLLHGSCIFEDHPIHPVVVLWSVEEHWCGELGPHVWRIGCFSFIFKPWFRSLARKCSSRNLVNQQKTRNVHNTDASLFYWLQKSL